MILNKRHRRLRSEAWTRNLVRESNVSSFDFILPIFLTEGNNKKEEISSMPGVFRYSPDNSTVLHDS